MSSALLAAATITLPSSPTWESEGLDICDISACVDDRLAGKWVDFITAMDNIPTVCTNLIGEDGELGYGLNERRITCIQMANGDNAYKWEFAVSRNICSLHLVNLDVHSCTDIFTKILDGYIDWCNNIGGTDSMFVGGHQQVGCFDL